MLTLTLPRCREERGFTLVELLMVLLIIGLLAGASFPHFLSLREHYQLRLTVWKLAGHLRLARNKAVTRLASYRLCFAECGEEIHPRSLYIHQREESGR